MLCFEGLDLVGMLQRQADFVEAVEQAVLAVRRDVEREPLAGRIAHGMLFCLVTLRHHRWLRTI